MFSMDGKPTGIFWMNNVYRKLEAMYTEVDRSHTQFVKETTKYVETQMNNVGDNVRRFYEEVMQDLLPPSSEDPICLHPSVPLDEGFVPRPEDSIRLHPSVPLDEGFVLSPEDPINLHPSVPLDEGFATQDTDKEKVESVMSSLNEEALLPVVESEDCSEEPLDLKPAILPETSFELNHGKECVTLNQISVTLPVDILESDFQKKTVKNDVADCRVHSVLVDVPSPEANLPDLPADNKTDHEDGLFVLNESTEPSCSGSEKDIETTQLDAIFQEQESDLVAGSSNDSVPRELNKEDIGIDLNATHVEELQETEHGECLVANKPARVISSQSSKTKGASAAKFPLAKVDDFEQVAYWYDVDMNLEMKKKEGNCSNSFLVEALDSEKWQTIESSEIDDWELV
ncbi:uncharacterized protein LOC18442168 [Amborella trichopoda]|uniref:uncharacterized protein LOC18442168 n=1 Tax=Amborella trichopoda TaxID=13333 RepID=UPI0005D2F78D|nr:uncharacterized protein LOC18442168 [Amborella trichopoda]XP_020527833.1 uncharacterized protein LOC18442168 [Amborella trichopoda]|eukprot:XP_011626268.1 uncharacterized protein LOC18442168 [Amborella trichopoda]